MDIEQHPIFRTLDLDHSFTTVASIARRYHEGELELNPPYQRGHVWGAARQRALIESLTRGLPISSIFINERDVQAPEVLLDGKQRVTAVLAWVDGNLTVPSCWFPTFNRGEVRLRADDAPEMISFHDLTPAGQLGWKNHAGISVYTTKFTENALAQEEMLFNLINFGGLAQGHVDDEPAAAPSPPRNAA